jgi:hypothetical protein
MAIATPYRSEQAERLFKAPEWKLINDQAVKFTDVKVYEFNLGDVEDPDLYAGEPLYQWQQTEAGKWVMAHAVDIPFWHRAVNPHSFGWTYYVIARLSEQDQTYWTLKWKSHDLV